MVSRGLLLLLAIVFFDSHVFAAVKPDDVHEATIPIIIEKAAPIPKGADIPILFYGDGQLLLSRPMNEQLLQISVSGLKNIIKTFKEEICIANKNGSFEISLQFDADAKVFGIGVSGKSGIIAKVSCN